MLAIYSQSPSCIVKLVADCSYLMQRERRCQGGGAETVNPSGAPEFTAGTNGAETVNPSGAHEFTAGFEWGTW
jgi:hypothetical protein